MVNSPQKSYKDTLTAIQGPQGALVIILVGVLIAGALRYVELKSDLHTAHEALIRVKALEMRVERLERMSYHPFERDWSRENPGPH